VSFDCYGTLVDWERGLAEALRAEWPGLDDAARGRFVEARGAEEWRILSEMEAFSPYRAVLAESVLAAAARLELPADADRAARVAASIGTWPPFSDAAGALRRLGGRFRLAIASNVDRGDLERTLVLLGSPDVHCVTAEHVGCYKPEPDHLMALLHELGLDEDELLHVSACPEFDLETAQDLGIPAAYVDRRDVPLPEEIEVAFAVSDLDELATRLLAMPRPRPWRGGARPR
jgi:2-haloalkanoic acid dehalogenase type II